MMQQQHQKKNTKKTGHGFYNMILPFLSLLLEPMHEKTNNLRFRPDPTQTGLYSHRRMLDAGKFGFRK